MENSLSREGARDEEDEWLGGLGMESKEVLNSCLDIARECFNFRS